MTKTKKRYHNKNKNYTRKRKNLPKDLKKISDSVKDIINEKLYQNYRNIAVNNLSVNNLENLETITNHSIKRDLTAKKSYSPSINKKLISVKSIRTHPLFACNDIAGLEKTVPKKSLKVQVKYKGQLVCTDATNPIAKTAFLSALKNNKITCNNIIPPIQYHTNCWFNTMFMCLFISDKGRKFTRYLRQAMIEGKLINGKIISPKSLHDSLILFNAAIEAVKNKNKVLSNESLALNTNVIIHNIYKSIPKSFNHSHYGIKNVDEYGNPLAFYSDLIEYIDAKNAGSPTLKILSGSKEVESFLSGSSNENSDIVAVQLFNNSYTPSYAQANHLKKRTMIKHDTNTYKLDSAIIRDNNHTHFGCAITCNKRDMLYDGAAFTKLVSKKWKSLINKNKDWNLSGSKTTWNFKKGYQILFYYKH